MTNYLLNQWCTVPQTTYAVDIGQMSLDHYFRRLYISQSRTILTVKLRVTCCSAHILWQLRCLIMFAFSNSIFDDNDGVHLYVQTILWVTVDLPKNSMSKHRHIKVLTHSLINTLRPRQNGRHFAEDTFKRIFLNENVIISIQISLKFVPKGPINNIPALVQIMAWRRSGDKPLS